MILERIEAELATAFPESKITADFHRYYKESGLLKNGMLEFVIDDAKCNLELDTQLEVVCRVVQLNYRPVSQEVRVLAAVGGVVSETNGFVVPRFFFAKLFYQDTDGPYSIDVDSSDFNL
jgi:hypothetical protein